MLKLVFQYRASYFNLNDECQQPLNTSEQSTGSSSFTAELQMSAEQKVPLDSWYLNKCKLKCDTRLENMFMLINVVKFRTWA